MKEILYIMLPVLLCGCSAGSFVLDESNIAQVVDSLSLDEKIRLVTGTCTDPANPPYPAPGTEKSGQKYLMDGVNTSSAAKKVQGSAGESFAVPRLGIPSVVYADGPAGLRIDPVRQDNPGKGYWCTAFPSATLIAASWDTGLAHRVGEAIGNEVLEYGADIILGPAMNIKRNPLTGRNFEYYSEDPLLSGEMAAAVINGIQSNGVGTSLKHYAVNNQETYRNGINAIVSERALREIYLRGFEIAVRKAQPWTVMSSYNKINGEYASESAMLLTGILRDEWGFKGYVVTDWWGADDPVAQMKAGNDMLMPGTPAQIEILRKAVEDGELDEAIIDRNVARILGVTVKTPAFRGYRHSDRPDLESHAAVAREAAAEGMVLLENNGALPLEKPCRLALFGNFSYDTQAGGSGSGYVHRKYRVNIDEGLADAGFVTDSLLTRMYTSHIAAEKAKLPPENFWSIPIAPEMTVEDDIILKAAKTDDAAIFTIGRMSGEGGDRSSGKGDYLLSDAEMSLLSRVCDAFHAEGKKVTVVVNAGDAIEFTGWNRMPDAILMAWLPGQEAGHAVADVLTGKVNPSGRLPMTFAARYTDIPSSRNFGVSPGETNAVRYEEDLMVGYRYFTTSGVQPVYGFGYGLSYTDFGYSDLHVCIADGAAGDAAAGTTGATDSGAEAGTAVATEAGSGTDAGNDMKTDAGTAMATETDSGTDAGNDVKTDAGTAMATETDSGTDAGDNAETDAGTDAEAEITDILLTVKVKVTNTGRRAGKEVVQVYVNKPAISGGRPARELCAFAKTGLLAPGESAEMTLAVGEDDLRQWDEAKHRWVIPAGKYTFTSGNLSAEFILQP